MVTNDIIEILLLLLVASLLGALVYWLFNRSRWKLISEQREWFSKKLSETEDKYKLLSVHASQLEGNNKEITDQLNLSLASNTRLNEDLSTWQLKYNGLEKTSTDQQGRIAFLEPFQAQAASLAASLKNAEANIVQLTGEKAALSADIARLNALKAQLEAETTALQAKIGQLNGEVDSQKALIISLNNQIGGLNNDIAAHKETIAGLNAEIGGLSNDIAAHKETIAGLNAEIGGLNNDIAAHKETIAGLNAEIGGLNNDIAAHKETIAGLNAEIGGLNNDIAAHKATIAGLNAEIGGLNNDIAAHKTTIAGLNAEVGSLHYTIDTHKATISGLKTNLTGLTNNLSANEGQLGAANAVQTALMAQIKGLQNVALTQNMDMTVLNDRIAELEALANKRSDLIAALSDDLNRLKLETETKLSQSRVALDDVKSEYDTLEAMYAELQAAYNQQTDSSTAKEGTISQLQADLAACRAAQQTATVVAATNLVSTGNDELDRIKQKRDSLDFATIGTADENEQDNLQLIKGIGPFIERKLHALSIYTFRQVANFTPDIRDKVNEAIEFFSGRIERENWVPQAAIFAQNQLTDYEKERLTKKAAKLDFSKIGTATAEQAQPLADAIDGLKTLTQIQLNHIGIYTFEQLANCPVVAIAEVLDFTPQRIKDERWLEQAATLAKG